MRPIAYGIIVFFGSGILWLLFSVIVGIGLGLGGEVPPLLMGLVYVFGVLFFFSLPIAIIAEIVRWWTRRRRKESTSREEKERS